MPFYVIPAKVPRQARDPEVVEWAGIKCKKYGEFLDAGSVIPDLIRDRHDGYGSPPEDAVNFKSIPPNRLVLQRRVV